MSSTAIGEARSSRVRRASASSWRPRSARVAGGAVAARRTDKVRMHLVLGFSPWLDYLPEERAWVLNEYYGRLHPFDMLDEGLIYPNARVALAA